MDNTTLHTFLFHCPAALRSVVLLGSWDNFSKPYPLELDARRGRNHWRGCFTFSNIICDGDLSDLAVKRDGLLKMGGTYWYYYKVDDDEECHDLAESSTTVCPLLPGQRLNVLDIPSEKHSRSSSEPSDGFTRNPSDRYLNPVPPVPPKPLSSPRLDVPSLETYAMPLHSPWIPRSATYPPADAFLSPNVVRHARSASASPHMPSTPLFADFRGLKDKLTSKRSATRTRSLSKAQELEIGSPVLISSTVKDLNLVPLASYRSSAVSAAMDSTPTPVIASRPVPTIRKEFSPLGSHPVDPERDLVLTRGDTTVHNRLSLKRRRTHIPSTIITSEFKLDHSRNRANSADTRRTQHYLFSNDPWLSSPKLQESFEQLNQEADEAMEIVPVLQRPTLLSPPSDDERPTSRHGAARSPSVRQAPMDKDLPELPRYLTPAPLFACHSPSADDVLAEDPLEEYLQEQLLEEEEDDEVLGDLLLHYEEKPNSHFSTWSSESLTYSYPPSDEEGVLSPTFSSLTSNCSKSSSPQRLSIRYSYVQVDRPKHTQTTTENETVSEQVTPTINSLSASPPQLDDLRVSTFGSDLFSLDIQHAESAPRRHAACFGLGFQYSLPEDETTSKITITQDALRPEPSVQRESSISQLNGLLDEFAYLGEAVI